MREDIIFNQAKTGSFIALAFSSFLALIFTMMAIDIPDTYFYWILTAFSVFAMIKSFLSIIMTRPFILLSDKAILLYPNTLKEVEVYWEDISGFRLEYKYFRRNIHIGLYDETKYNFKEGDPYRGFTFHWAKIKRSDRQKFMEELEKRTKKNVNNLQSILLSEKEIKQKKRQLNLFYFLRAYLISLIFTIPLSLAEFFDSLMITIIYFLLFPLAKIFYDKALGFELFYRMNEDRAPGRHAGLLFTFILIMWFLSYIISPYLSALGLLLFIFDKIKGKGTKQQKNSLP